MTTQVGWIKFDGDEHFDFRYYRPDDRHILAQIASEGAEGAHPSRTHRRGMTMGRVDIPRRFRAAHHEIRCKECRITWRSWVQRILGMKRGFSPTWAKGRIAEVKKRQNDKATS